MGRLWSVSDLGSIESRVLGYLTNCARINSIFAQRQDTYKDFASAMYGIPYEDVTPEQRGYCKPPTLGCGFRMGGAALIAYAKGMHMPMGRRDAFRAVRVYREAFPEVKAFWTNIEDMVKLAIEGGPPQSAHHLVVDNHLDMLRVQLPSGRRLHYYQPRIEAQTVTYEIEDGSSKTMDSMGLTFTAGDLAGNPTRKSAHGGVLTENIVQAVASDILRVWMQRVDGAGLDIRMHVHDEVCVLAAEDEVPRMNALIRDPVSWLPGMVLDASGYQSPVYKKD